MSLEMFPISYYEEYARSESAAGKAPVKDRSRSCSHVHSETEQCSLQQMPFSSGVRPSRHLFQLGATLLCTSLRKERRWWAIHDSAADQGGLMERERALWHRIHEQYRLDGRGDAGDFLDRNYLNTFRVDYATWTFLLRVLEPFFAKKSTSFRQPITAGKRLGIVLYYLAHGTTFDMLGTIFHVGSSTAFTIVHEWVSIMKRVLVRLSIKFPTGPELQTVMAGFEAKHGLPLCAGALDGTFINMQKPRLWGDSYWCYKNKIAVILLGVCDHNGQFTYIDVGRAGSVGDAYAYRHSGLKAKIDADEWLNEFEQELKDVTVKPYLIGDAAFPLGPELMKNYDTSNHSHQKRFNAALTKTRQKIETAFGSLKGRWHILTDNFIRDPAYIRDISLVCASLHNVCERANCPYNASWNVATPSYILVGPHLPQTSTADMEDGKDIRFAIAQSV